MTTACGFPPPIAGEYFYIDDKFIPTKHLTPPPTTAASPHRLTPTRRHPCCTKRKGRARRRAAPTDLAHSWATQARPRKKAWARGTVQRHVDAGFSPSTKLRPADSLPRYTDWRKCVFPINTVGCTGYIQESFP